ncbi:hypothetical protein ACKLNO_07265 [Neisseriaceae bacterium B1]
MNQVNETEIRQLIADVMRDTGIRIDADDPIVAMLFAQKRELAQFLQQSSDEQNKQREQFLSSFQMYSESIMAAAAELQSQKQELLASLLQANAQDRAEMEQKVFGSISHACPNTISSPNNRISQKDFRLSESRCAGLGSGANTDFCRYGLFVEINDIQATCVFQAA